MKVVFEQTFDVDPRPLLEFSLPGDPKPAPRPRIVDGHAYNPTAYTAHREALSWEMRARFRGPPVTDYLFLDVVFVMSTKRRVDQDNLHKTLMDAGNGIVWADDHQFIGGQWATCYDPAAPRLDVAVYRILGPADA